jgi:hypothetical protein
VARLVRTTGLRCCLTHRNARLAITLFALITFTLQTYVVQTHVHGIERTSIAGAALILDKNAAHKQPSDKSPLGGDPANCPICQAILHTGYYVTPSVAALLPPIVVASAAPIVVDAGTIVEARSHSWQSRAPPLA